MHRIDSSGATADHLFTDGDETHGVEATTVDAAFLNAAQEELCAVIEGAGLTLAKGDHTQLAQAIAALIAAQAVTIGEASETVAGIIKLATQAMVDAGTDGKAAVTPATLAARLAAVLAAATPAQAGLMQYATGAEAATGTRVDRGISPATLRAGLNASGNSPIYAARAWANFSGAGTVSLRASGNISSVTDNGTGDYTLTFTTPMPDADYAVLVSVSATGATGAISANPQSQGVTVSAPTTTGVRIQVGNAVAGTQDPPYVNVAVFR